MKSEMILVCRSVLFSGGTARNPSRFDWSVSQYFFELRVESEETLQDLVHRFRFFQTLARHCIAFLLHRAGKFVS